MKLISRQQAKLNNKEFFFTGKTCKHGHTTTRFTKNGMCTQCYEDNKIKQKDYQKEYREANKEKMAEYQKDYQKEYREANKEKLKEYREANKEKMAQYQKEYREANKDKMAQYQNDYQKEYRVANKEKIEGYREANKDKMAQYQKEYRLNNYDRNMFQNAKHRAKKKGLEFTITMDDLPPIPERCPLLNIPINISTHPSQGGRDSSPSIDRINNELGYVPGNIQIISNKANRIKSNNIPEFALILLKENYVVD